MASAPSIPSHQHGADPTGAPLEHEPRALFLVSSPRHCPRTCREPHDDEQNDTKCDERTFMAIACDDKAANWMRGIRWRGFGTGRVRCLLGRDRIDVCVSLLRCHRLYVGKFSGRQLPFPGSRQAEARQHDMNSNEKHGEDNATCHRNLERSLSCLARPPARQSSFRHILNSLRRDNLP